MYHKETQGPNGAAEKFHFLDQGNTSALSASATYWQSTHPTDSVFSVSTNDNINTSGANMLAYCWAPKKGAAAFGWYKGNGSTSDGPYNRTTFKPEMVIVRCVSSSESWWRYSQAQENDSDNTNLNDVLNVSGDAGVVNDDSADLDIYHDGWRPQHSGNSINGNDHQYVWAAWGDSNGVGPDLDSVSDSPTNYEDDDSNVHGNFCTLNHLACGSNLTLSQGNLQFDSNANSYARCLGTMSVTSGKWYFEYQVNNANLGVGVGWANVSQSDFNGDMTTYLGVPGDYAFGTGGTGGTAGSPQKKLGNSHSTYGTTPANGDIIGVLLDLDNTTLSMKLNNSTSSWGDLTTSLPAGGTWVPLVGDGYQGGHVHGIVNFGQRAFKYPQSGYKALCTQNLDDIFSGDNLNNPSKFFDILQWVGNGANDNNQRGLAFQPDFAWIKCMSSTDTHVLVDAIRGHNKTLESSSNAAEYTASAPHHEVQAFLSDGVTTGQNGRVGANGDDYIGWFWDCGTAAATASTDGSITPSAQWVNATAGFSKTKWTGSGGNATIGHGLGAKPTFHIIKRTNSAADWRIYTEAVGNTKTLILQAKNHEETSGMYQDTDPTNTVISLSSDANGNASGDTYIMYCWTPITGYSKFGSFIGRGAANFIHTGFQPRWIMIKRSVANSSPDTDTSHTSWGIWDTKRKYNGSTGKVLWANSDVAEGKRGDLSGTSSLGDMEVDILSNGFYLDGPGTENNASTGEYIWAAFSEQPFKTARAQ